MKKLAVLVAAFALVLSVAAPALAQEEPIDGPAPKIGSVTAPESQYETTVVCSQQAVPQAAPQEEATELPAASLDSDGDPCAPQTGNTGNTGNFQTMPDTESSDVDPSFTPNAPACARCTDAVLTAAQEAIMGGGSDSPAPEEAFGAALQAARDAGGSATREAVASEEGQQSPTPAEDTVAYQVAFEAAKDAGADDDTAREAAIEAVADLLPDEAVGSASTSSESSTSEASKSSKGGSGEGIAATEGKTSKGDASKGDASKGDASKGDASKGDASKDRKDKPHEDDASEEENADEEATEDTDEEIVASGEDGGSGDAPSFATPADSKAPLLLGGVALLSVGGFAALGLARSWPPSSARGRRLLRN